jgi:hypothetical protein
MGLHSGEALLEGGDVVGYDVNRAARIAGAAHGGQIVVSDAVRSLAGAGSDGTFELRDLGEHRLKDLLAPERLAQVVAADLRTEFPPIHSLDARPNNLPTQLTSFVGRETELEEALRLLSGTRLLTLTGPGGIGKTRLSLQIAAAASDDFPDGIWFVPLEPVRERELVAPTIARVFGVTEKASQPILDGIAEAIGSGRVLFVLDNFEQAIDAAPIVPRCSPRSPGLRILVSSRIALRCPGAGVRGARAAGSARPVAPVRARAAQPAGRPAHGDRGDPSRRSMRRSCSRRGPARFDPASSSPMRMRRPSRALRPASTGCRSRSSSRRRASSCCHPSRSSRAWRTTLAC